MGEPILQEVDWYQHVLAEAVHVILHHILSIYKYYFKGSLERLLVACNCSKLDVRIPTAVEFVLENVMVEELDKDAIFDRIMKINVLKVYPWEVHTLLPKVMPRMWWVKDQVNQDPWSDSMSVTKLIAEASTFLGMIEV